MRTVKEVSKLTGVSVRTLHYYDTIDLLKPTQVTSAGYRLYDDAALKRLQNILLFRELQFPLKEIREILDDPDFDPAQALADQIRLLEIKRRHIDGLISFAREIQKKGVTKMSFYVFDQSEIEQYKAEAKKKWGHTKAWKEYEEKAQNRQETQQTAQSMTDLFGEIGKLRHLSPSDGQVQEKIAALQAFITENYYTCTNEILESLGQMYVQDERFKKNIDQAGGANTAGVVSQAFDFYCKGKKL